MLTTKGHTNSMLRHIVVHRSIALIALCFIAFAADATEFSIRADEYDVVMRKSSPWGEYWQFTPASPREIVVLVHGTVENSDSPAEAARRHIFRWTSFAQRKRVLVLSMAFNRHDYQTGFVGYRGLFGRKVGADEFVDNVVERYKNEVEGFDGTFFLYGHSAGAQFSCRYSVRHPERLRGVVLSAPGRYAFPDIDATWPYGMGRLKRKVQWNKSEPPQNVVVYPDPKDWVKAASLPYWVVIGNQDLEKRSLRPGHLADNRVQLAHDWVDAMRTFVEQRNAESNIQLVVAPGIGHSSSDLTPYCQRAMSRAISRSRLSRLQQDRVK